MTALPMSDAAAQSAAPCAANDSPPLSPFLIRIGPRGAPRLEFGAMGASSTAVFNKYVDLADIGERVEIVAVRP